MFSGFLLSDGLKRKKGLQAGFLHFSARSSDQLKHDVHVLIPPPATVPGPLFCMECSADEVPRVLPYGKGNRPCVANGRTTGSFPRMDSIVRTCFILFSPPFFTFSPQMYLFSPDCRFLARPPPLFRQTLSLFRYNFAPF